MKNFTLEKYGHISPIASDFENLNKTELLKIIERLDPSRMKKETADFALRALEIKIHEEFQAKMLRKQNLMVGATWALVVATVVLVLVS